MYSFQHSAQLVAASGAPRLAASEASSVSLLAVPALRERGLYWQPKTLSWAQWCQQQLREIWAPQLRELQHLAASSQLRDFVRQAQAASEQLTVEARQESLLAGEELLRHSEGARGNEVLLKLYRSHLAKEQHQEVQLCWFHSVLAARAAFFCLSQSSLILAFAWREWRSQQRLRVVLEADELWAEFEAQAAPDLLKVMPECLDARWQVRRKKDGLRQELEG